MLGYRRYGICTTPDKKNADVIVLSRAVLGPALLEIKKWLELIKRMSATQFASVPFSEVKVQDHDSHYPTIKAIIDYLNVEYKDWKGEQMELVITESNEYKNLKAGFEAVVAQRDQETERAGKILGVVESLEKRLERIALETDDEQIRVIAKAGLWDSFAAKKEGNLLDEA